MLADPSLTRDYIFQNALQRIHFPALVRLHVSASLVETTFLGIPCRDYLFQHPCGNHTSSNPLWRPPFNIPCGDHPSSLPEESTLPYIPGSREWSCLWARLIQQRHPDPRHSQLILSWEPPCLPDSGGCGSGNQL